MCIICSKHSLFDFPVRIKYLYVSCTGVFLISETRGLTGSCSTSFHARFKHIKQYYIFSNSNGFKSIYANNNELRGLMTLQNYNSSFFIPNTLLQSIIISCNRFLTRFINVWWIRSAEYACTSEASTQNNTSTIEFKQNGMRKLTIRTLPQ